MPLYFLRAIAVWQVEEGVVWYAARRTAWVPLDVVDWVITQQAAIPLLPDNALLSA